jgi:uncharacterized membrane protein
MNDHLTKLTRNIGMKFRPNFGGTANGLLFFCLSFTPSLLPRGYVVQGVASGLSFVTGYAIGVLLSSLYHAVPRFRSWIMPATAKHIIIWFLLVLSVVFIALLLSLFFIWLARRIRTLARYFDRKLIRRLPRRVAQYGGAILTALVVIFLVNGVIVRGVFGFINYSFGLANKGTPIGIHQPQNSIYSGSPASAIDWNTLGEKGREFVATGPSQSDIAKFAGVTTITPSRLYAGLESAPSLQERVNLLVKELDRTHAANRQAVLIAIPTGSGGIDAKAVQSVEYLDGGNTTTLGIQYSYLPSWLSFVADQEKTHETGKVLISAVYDWWSHLPASHRPQLLMYGESLGTLGADGAFSGPADMHNRMNGVLLAGPPNANQLWKDIVSNRDTGTPEVLPVYQHGVVVRFSNGSNPFVDPKGTTWETSRIGFLQNASDPVVWASTALFIHKPDWLKEPRGSDVLPNMRWYPFITGWQVALDLPFAFGATPGHGHRYDPFLVPAWTSVLNKQLSGAQASQLQQIIDGD